MQGFNMGRYVPPDLEGVQSFNQASGKGHALGARASKLKTQGILTVRFEMPYAVWCGHCPKPTIIGQGVRFNAEKKKIGNYYSTPIWSFRMKHVACGGWIEIRTDPKTTRYLVVEGGKARDTGEDKIREGEEGLEILTAEEREKRREDAFATLEGRVEDKATEKDNKRRIEELLEERERHWEDPYKASRLVRKGFRRDRKMRGTEADKAEKIRDRMGLAVELVPENEDDKRRAALIDFGETTQTALATTKPLFQMESTGSLEKEQNTARPARHQTKAAAEAERKRKLLEQNLRDSTRAAQDPFTVKSAAKIPTASLPSIRGIKRKNTLDCDQDAQELASISIERPVALEKSHMEVKGVSSLVEYDSE